MAFYTLFRVHLTLVIVYICPKKVLYCSFWGSLCLDGKYAGKYHFWTCFGTNGKQRNSAKEESSNGTSQDEVSSHLLENYSRRRRKIQLDAVGIKCRRLYISQDLWRRRTNQLDAVRIILRRLNISQDLWRHHTNQLDAVGIILRRLNIRQPVWRRRKVTLDAVAAHDETLDSGSFYSPTASQLIKRRRHGL